MNEEFILDFDNTKTTQDKFNVEIHVNMRVNGREMFRNIDHTDDAKKQIYDAIINKMDTEIADKLIDNKEACRDAYRIIGNIRIVSKPEYNNVSTTIPVYPQEFASWFLRLIPRLTQPRPKKQKAIFHWRMDHEMPAIGGGIIWPDITIYGKNDMVFIQEKPFQYNYPKGVARYAYTECITVVVSKRCFIDGVKAFVAKLENTMCFIEDRELYL